MIARPDTRQLAIEALHRAQTMYSKDDSQPATAFKRFAGSIEEELSAIQARIETVRALT